MLLKNYPHPEEVLHSIHQGQLMSAHTPVIKWNINFTSDKSVEVDQHTILCDHTDLLLSINSPWSRYPEVLRDYPHPGPCRKCPHCSWNGWSSAEYQEWRIGFHTPWSSRALPTKYQWKPAQCHHLSLSTRILLGPHWRDQGLDAHIYMLHQISVWCMRLVCHPTESLCNTCMQESII